MLVRPVWARYAPEAGVALLATIALLNYRLATGLVLAGLLTILLVRGNVGGLGAKLALAAVLTCSWNVIKIAGNTAGDIFFVSALVLLLLQFSGRADRQRLHLPLWMVVGGVGLALAAFGTYMYPPPAGYFLNRFSAQAASASSLGAGATDTTGLLRFEAALVVAPLVLWIACREGLVRPKTFADVWAVGVIASCLVAVSDSVGLTHLSTSYTGDQLAVTGRSSGLTVTPNHLAVSLALVLPIVMTWFTRGRRGRLCGIGGMAVVLGGLYTTQSAGGTLGAALAIGLSLVLIPELRKYNLRAAFGLVLLVLMLAGPFAASGSQLLSASRLDRSNTTSALASDIERQALGDQAKQDFGVRPLSGVGFSQITSGHRVYLQLLAASGLIGLVAYYVYILGALRMGFSRGSPGGDRTLTRAAGVSLLTFVIMGLVENQLTDRYIYVSVGLLLACRGLVRPGSGPRPMALAKPLAESAVDGLREG